MTFTQFNEPGLDRDEVLRSREVHGSNALQFKKQNTFLRVLKSLLTEPMVLLLLVTSTLYFVLGETGDGIFLAAAILAVSGISIFQDARSRSALENLNTLSQPQCQVIRGGAAEDIVMEDVVVGDYLIAEQGATIAADGTIVHSNDFSVDESLLTGESLPVFRDAGAEYNLVFRGTTVISGLAIIRVTEVGNQTRLGKIGKSLEAIKEAPTPLELQIKSFVKKMSAVGILVFLLVWGINYFQSRLLLNSLLKGLTLAMSILPEEIPVAFATFMALGAWRLMKMGIIVKQMKTVETLGSATVICADKTGTITKNEMALVRLYEMGGNRITDPAGPLSREGQNLIRLAMWASEPIPFDPMEQALHATYSKIYGPEDERPLYRMVHEYPLDGKPPMMTHIFEDDHGHRIIAAKGAPEALIAISGLSPTEKEQINGAFAEMARQGYRILGVAEATLNGTDFPERQQEFPFRFKGLVAFYDPPKDNIREVFQAFREAGIRIKIITGDTPLTARAIAEQIRFEGRDEMLEGDQLLAMGEAELENTVERVQIFTRMFPEAKLRVINALKARGEIVAMTGDGINDGPALKAAHIGVAMGQKGTAIAKDSAALILLEDDLSKILDAVAMGRKIYDNLKKAIQYVISIHIPIILTVFLPLALGWIYPNIFSPTHIILLELIMGPTCSILYENEPMEKQTMKRKPRPFTTTFFKWKELLTSIIQGLVITLGTLLTYQYSVKLGYGEDLTRAMVFTMLLMANIFLTLVNRSFYYSMLTTLGYKNRLVPLIIGIALFVTVSLVTIRPLAAFFEFETINLSQMAICAFIGIFSVVWFELVKWGKRLRV